LRSTVPLISRGQAILSFAHNRDIARALYLASITNSASGEAFNIVSFTTTLRQFFDAIAALYNKQVRYFPLNFYFAYLYALFSEFTSLITKHPSSITRRRVNQVGRTRIYNTNKIEHILGFKPEYDLNSTLKEVYDWLTTST